MPDEIAIAGFEDSPFSRQTWPMITTAAQPTNLIALPSSRIFNSTFSAPLKPVWIVFLIYTLGRN
ncbi:hypothetical protein [uncultured Paraglaciecola sp.]|uniref:hypothetical protein n=1 Tax=uncultured Paraglaciecola sp. TaxID=1765024 RepID=UPI00344B4775